MKDSSTNAFREQGKFALDFFTWGKTVYTGVQRARTYVIAQPCVDVKDKACIDECPVDGIYEGDRALYIHPSECVDGAGDPACPVEAIYYSDDVADEWADYVRANAEFFAEIGSPQGAAAVDNMG